MKYLIIFCLSTLFLFSSAQIRVEKKQAKAAFELLNKIRENPKKFKKKLDLFDLDKITRKNLVWNKDLAKVAEFRAKDMAERDYFDHVSPEGIGVNYYIEQAGYDLNVNWLKNKKANNFESIAWNWPTAEAGIRGLIIGKESPGYHHRKHLLGMDEWNSSLSDIGIGFVTVKRKSGSESYLCVIIAKHDW
ncbi:CAP domain-containing protein [Sphingobacterium sp. SRCM116780]|uniref:CAP domain-containing protein n=1 Tax=Sphingobacterium sp. SRCM116780 TaxID=2907623 RepID=UPI001F1E2366|nr:CAP domain-containing protein [Sphingobacterium sp. SRCM116780]UIR55733.1 CAP domain-containing protein [Sphingobacterium sp. SRCM116780]